MRPGQSDSDQRDIEHCPLPDNIHHTAMNAACAPSQSLNSQLINSSTHKLTNSQLTKMIKNLKTWKTVIQFVITVLTAIVTSLGTTACM